MNIDGVNPLGGMERAESKVESEQQNVRSEQTSEQSTSSDTVQVRSESEMARYRAEIDKIPEVRTEKVEALQRAVEEGNYNVPSEDIAAKILEELI